VPDARWPITRGELETRLSLALEHAVFLLRDDGTPLHPGDMAAELVDAIDAQGDRPHDPGLVAPLAVPDDSGLLPPPPEPDPELAAIAVIKDALASLDDADAVERIVLFVAHWCGVQVT
jgi:hypothetical protein